jgi:hypothetical protein
LVYRWISSAVSGIGIFQLNEPDAVCARVTPESVVRIDHDDGPLYIIMYPPVQYTTKFRINKTQAAAFYGRFLTYL